MCVVGFGYGWVFGFWWWEGHFKKVCVLSLREGVLFVVVERVEELVVFPREGTGRKKIGLNMFCPFCLFVLSFSLSASWF